MIINNIPSHPSINFTVSGVHISRMSDSVSCDLLADGIHVASYNEAIDQSDEGDFWTVFRPELFAEFVTHARNLGFCWYDLDFGYFVTKFTEFELIQVMARKNRTRVMTAEEVGDSNVIGDEWAIHHTYKGFDMEAHIASIKPADDSDSDEFDYEHSPDCPICLRNREHTAEEHFAALKRNSEASKA